MFGDRNRGLALLTSGTIRATEESSLRPMPGGVKHLERRNYRHRAAGVARHILDDAKILDEDVDGARGGA